MFIVGFSTSSEEYFPFRTLFALIFQLDVTLFGPGSNLSSVDQSHSSHCSLTSETLSLKALHSKHSVPFISRPFLGMLNGSSYSHFRPESSFLMTLTSAIHKLIWRPSFIMLAYPDSSERSPAL
ncbi:unnamed protein product [Dicrocoelium dendriticum]|nr:unnamed protein product [Dicrocoelium dendriticum]